MMVSFHSDFSIYSSDLPNLISNTNMNGRVFWCHRYYCSNWAILPTRSGGASIILTNASDRCRSYVCLDTPRCRYVLDLCVKSMMLIIGAQCSSVQLTSGDNAVGLHGRCALGGWKPMQLTMDIIRTGHGTARQRRGCGRCLRWHGMAVVIEFVKSIVHRLRMQWRGHRE